MKRLNINVDNGILGADAYKLLHHLMQKPGYSWLTSYLESRFGAKYDTTVVIGIFDVLSKMTFAVTKTDISEAIAASHDIFGFQGINVEIWKKVEELGYMPMLIRGIPEGYTVPVGTPLLKVEPTEEWFAPVCNAIETKLTRVWYPMTLATRLKRLRDRVQSYYYATGTSALGEFAINDFGSRSASCDEQGKVSGMVHLMVCGSGSDNVMGQLHLNDLYGYQNKLKSVWATEHSVALSFGPGEGEYEYIKHQLSQYTDKLKSIVADTYDYNNFVEVVMRRPDVQALIDAHEGRIMIRPDSGDYFENVLWTLNTLEKQYGSYINDKGYKVLNCDMGVIQGDGMNEDSICELYEYIIENDWSADNMVVGAGTGIMFEGLTRDTQRFAIKPSANIINGELINTIKDPKTDPTKRSKGGLLKVDKNFVTHTSMDYEDNMDEFYAIECIMMTYYKDGVLAEPDFMEIMARLNS